MTKPTHPASETLFEELSTDAKERHEQLVALFGEYVVWLTNWTIESAQMLVDSNAAVERIGTVRGKVYEDISKLAPHEKEQALKLSASAVNSFVDLLVRVLSHQGYDFGLGESHAVRFRLALEIIDIATGDVVVDETINRGGKRHFADYLGRWRNRRNEA